MPPRVIATYTRTRREAPRSAGGSETESTSMIAGSRAAISRHSSSQPQSRTAWPPPAACARPLARGASASSRRLRTGGPARQQPLNITAAVAHRARQARDPDRRKNTGVNTAQGMRRNGERLSGLARPDQPIREVGPFSCSSLGGTCHTAPRLRDRPAASSAPPAYRAPAATCHLQHARPGNGTVTRVAPRQ